MVLSAGQGLRWQVRAVGEVSIDFWGRVGLPSRPLRPPFATVVAVQRNAQTEWGGYSSSMATRFVEPFQSPGPSTRALE